MSPGTVRPLLFLCAFFHLACSGTVQGAPASNDPITKEYVQRVSDIISSMWMRELRRSSDMAVAGTVQVTFRVTRDGKIENLKVLSNTSNEAVANISILVIAQAQLPPIPADVLKNRSPWIDIHLPLTVNPPRMLD